VSVHLIHIGFPKTGSTYLQSWFAGHPQIAYRPRQLAGCGSVHELIDQVAFDGAAMPRVTSCEDFAAPSRDHREWSGMPAAQVAVCETLHGLFPIGHILIVTRGFKAIIESAYAELVRFGRAQSFSQFIRSETILDILPDILDYDRLIDEYRRRFDDRVTVLPYELLRDVHRSFLGVVEAILGVDPHPASPLPENVRLSPEELRWYPRIAGAIARLPIGDRFRRSITALHVRAIRSGRMRSGVRVLDELMHKASVPADRVPDEVLQHVRSGAKRLVKERWHRPYAAEYLG
jgi:hypothetical protein